MTKKNQIYRCSICGNVVEVTNSGDGTLVCCGQPMERMKENTVDAAVEKHVPVIEKIDGGFKVSVGKVEHPMIEQHYIMWIELIFENGIMRAELQPDEKPEAVFLSTETPVAARAYCNLHGLWKSE